MEKIMHDRRVADQPYDVERRISERVSVLEIRADNSDQRHEDTQELLHKFISKFDGHLVAEETHTRTLSTTLIRVTNTVDNLTNEIKRTNDTIATFATKVEHTHEKVSQWDTVIKTLIKVAVIGSIVTGAMWAVFTFAVDRYDKSQKASIETITNNNIQ